jgi:hypothetical protein
MKLNELAVANPTKQAAKVFESYFGDRVTFDTIDQTQALKMLRRVRGLVAEHRRTPEFHRSEQNPAYLKLVVMEQALSARIMELDAQPAAPVGQPNPQAMAMQIAQRKKQLQDQLRQAQEQVRMIQGQLSQSSMGMAESRRRVTESEVQQAQVVLAAQDMVDEVQKMSEQVSAMQFKDLPALVDQIKNQVGPDQATQFNGDASAALSALLQNLQASKQQLDQALGVVTGQAPAIPGDDMGADMGADADLGGEMPAELPAPGEEEIDTDIEVDDVEDSNSLATSLGRGRR